MHDHDHGVRAGVADSAFAIGFVLNAGFVVAEAVYGVLAGSLALVADAGHNLGDVLGVLLAWGAVRLARREPTSQHTYGLQRGTILAALGNSLLLMAAVGIIAWEAIGRLGSPEPIETGIVMWVAGVGVVINTVTALLFARGRHHDLNARAVFVHMSADAAISVGVVAVGLFVRFTGALWIDPVAGLVIAAVIAIGAWGVLRDSMRLALDAVPVHVDIDAVRHYLESLPGVDSVHDLHVWPLSTTAIALTAHLLKPSPDGDDELLSDITCELTGRFGIKHVTIQWERDEEAYVCAQRCRLPDGEPGR